MVAWGSCLVNGDGERCGERIDTVGPMQSLVRWRASHGALRRHALS